MSKIKLIDLIVSAATALLTAAKSVIKFIDYISKLREKKKQPATSAV